MPFLLLLLLASQVFTTFLSETKFIPSIQNNLGAFEVNAIVLIGALSLYFHRNNLPVRLHPIAVIIGLWYVVSLLSLFYVQRETIEVSIIAVIILLFQLFFTIALSNLLLLGKSHLLFVLRCFAFSAVIVGFWVLLDQFMAPGDYNVAGPFRNRSHMGIYMMGAFWILLFYRFFPGVTPWERWASYPILALVTYTIAVSLRQSIYVALIAGIAGLSLGALLLRGWQRLAVGVPILFILCFSAILFLMGPQDFAPLALFRRELSGVGTRMEEATNFADIDPSDDPGGPAFDALQRAGALKAFSENPLLGIGWMGFYHSPYSLTGHELHSSTLRFLAELGIVGFTLYLCFIGLVLIQAFRLVLLCRGTSYQLSAWILFVALCTYTLSQYYNRMFTDRPYWFVLVIFIAFEALVLGEVQPKPSVPVLTAPRMPSESGLAPADG